MQMGIHFRLRSKAISRIPTDIRMCTGGKRSMDLFIYATGALSLLERTDWNRNHFNNFSTDGIVRINFNCYLLNCK